MKKIILAGLLYSTTVLAQPTPGAWIEPPGPFNDGTWSKPQTQIYYEDTKGTITTYPYDPTTYPCLNAEPQVPVYDNQYVGGQTATDAALNNTAMIRLMADYHPSGDDFVQLATPPVVDWGLIHRVPRLGVQIDSVGHYVYTYGCNPMSPSNCVPRWCNIVNTLRWQLEYGFFTAYSELKTDIHVDAVYIRENDYPPDSTYVQDLGAAKTKWLSFPADIGAVLRIGLDVKKDLADTGDTCGPKSDFRFASADFWLDANPSAVSYNNNNYVLWMHEMSHNIFRAPHTQCLWIGGQPVEQCPDGGFCYSGPEVCPPKGQVSLMGYCIWDCGYVSSNIFEHLTYGAEDERIVLRSHILSSSCYAAEPACQINPDGGNAWPILVVGFLGFFFRSLSNSKTH